MIYKLFSKILHARIHAKLNKAQSRDQAGFRPDYACEDHLFVITQLAERHNEFGIPLWVATIDFKKAFDTINHSILWEALGEQEIERTYIEMLQHLYARQTAKVRTDTASRKFDIGRGTKQGDPISPPLFNAVIEHLVRKLKSRWAEKGWGIQLRLGSAEKLTNLRFADDILLTASSLPQLKKLLADLAKTAKTAGLEPHAGKTKILHNGVGYGVGAKKARVANMDIDILSTESATTYLGRSLRLKAGTDEEIGSRISKAWAKFGTLRAELTNKNISIKKRLKLFDATISPTILYACSSWAMTLERQRKLRTTQRKMVRTMTRCHAHFKGDTTEDYVAWITASTKLAEELTSKYEVKDWVSRQAGIQWKWAERVANRHDGRWTKEVLSWSTVTNRKQGRPEKRWVDDISKLISKETGTITNDQGWIAWAKNRTCWSKWQEAFVHQQQIKDDFSAVSGP